VRLPDSNPNCRHPLKAWRENAIPLPLEIHHSLYRQCLRNGIYSSRHSSAAAERTRCSPCGLRHPGSNGKRQAASSKQQGERRSKGRGRGEMVVQLADCRRRPLDATAQDRDWTGSSAATKRRRPLQSRQRKVFTNAPMSACLCVKSRNGQEPPRHTPCMLDHALVDVSMRVAASSGIARP